MTDHKHRFDPPDEIRKALGDARHLCRECGRAKLKESDFRTQLVGTKGLADDLGWEHVGFRPARTAYGWRTPGTGTMAQGWPDLTLVHPRTGRLVFAELKGDGGKVDPQQARVLAVLRSLEERPSVEVWEWWPDDIEAIAKVLGPR